MKAVDIRVVGEENLGRGRVFEIDMNALTDKARVEAESLFTQYQEALQHKEWLIETDRGTFLTEEWHTRHEKIYQQWRVIGQIEDSLHELYQDGANYRGINGDKVKRGLKTIFQHKYVHLTMGLTAFGLGVTASQEGQLGWVIFYGTLALTEMVKISMKHQQS